MLDDPVIGALAEQHDKTARRSCCVGISRSATSSSGILAPARIAENVDVFDFHHSDRELELIGELDRGGRIGPDPDTFVRP